MALEVYKMKRLASSGALRGSSWRRRGEPTIKSASSGNAKCLDQRVHAASETDSVLSGRLRQLDG